MSFRALLDANVLYPFSLRDSLLTLAEYEFYVPLWSQRILDEAARSLVREKQMTEEQAARLTGHITGAFPEAMVSEEAVASLEGAMTNDAGDRHVLAAAVAGSAEAIITSNLRDFPAAACEPYAIEPTAPDDFLMAMFHMEPALVEAIIVQQAKQLSRPSRTLHELLDMLHRSGCRAFASAVGSNSGWTPDAGP